MPLNAPTPPLSGLDALKWRCIGPSRGGRVVAVSVDRNNPRILFAAFWEARRNFWNISSGGPGSGLFRSKDGGDTWEEVSSKPGFADRPLGKIGVSGGPGGARRVGAL